MIYQNLTQLIGNTPLVELTNYNKALGLKGKILAKLEYFNPLGSIKDRAAFYMITHAERMGKINKDTVIIEPTSGNTGIGLAYVCACKGYRLMLTMPETMSMERRQLLAALGAELILTPGSEGMQGSINKAYALAKELGNTFIPNQFENPANPQAHRETTAPELLKDMGKEIAAFVACFGTGGTVTGTGEVLKKEIPGIRIVGVEPASSPLVSKGTAGPHKIQGIGANFVPAVLNRDILDEILLCENEDAFAASRMVGKSDGILVGISSGAALWAATQLAKKEEYAGKNIVVIFPDGGERYLSSGLYEG